MDVDASSDNVLTAPPPYSLEPEPSRSGPSPPSSAPPAISQPSQVTFHGRDSTECRTFIQEVRRQAFEQNLNDARTAAFALTGLHGAALDWQLSLEDDVSESWKLLQKALKEKYLAAPSPSRPLPLPAHVSGRSAVTHSFPRPLGPQNGRTGCIQVRTESALGRGSTLGFIYMNRSSQLVLTNSMESALVVTWLASPDFGAFTIAERPDTNVALRTSERITSFGANWYDLQVTPQETQSVTSEIWRITAENAIECDSSWSFRTGKGPLLEAYTRQFDETTALLLMKGKLSGSSRSKFQKVRLVFCDL